MAKKYLTQEEAAARLGIGVDELNAIRESGDLRGFADRGTWKFREEDVQEAVRSRQVASDPEIPLLGGSGIDLEEDEAGASATVIRSGSIFDDEEPRRPGASDSDVRLILDDTLQADDDFAPPISDSDVRLVDSDVTLAGNSDSDVQLVGSAGTSDSDSDVALAADSGVLAGDDEELDSDSDVALFGDSGSILVGGDDADDGDSDVRLVPPSSGLTSDSDVQLVGSSGIDSAHRPGSDSDVALVSADGSGLMFSDEDDESSIFGDTDSTDDSGATMAAGSGIFSPSDSGINLEARTSGIELESDAVDDDAGSNLYGSDIALEDEDDGLLGDASEITLDGGFDDDGGLSGIALEDEGSGIALHSGDRTLPELDTPDFADDDRTEHDLVALESDDETFNLALDDDESDDEDEPTLLFEADDDSAAGDDAEDADDSFDLAGDDEEFEEDEGEFDEFEDEFDDDELEVAADIEGEDDELDDLDVFDDADDFEDDFESGSTAPAARGVPAPVEAEWGALTFVGLLFTFGLLCVGGVMMYDLVRTMWVVDGPTAANTGLLDTFADMFAGS